MSDKKTLILISGDPVDQGFARELASVCRYEFVTVASARAARDLIAEVKEPVILTDMSAEAQLREFQEHLARFIGTGPDEIPAVRSHFIAPPQGCLRWLIGSELFGHLILRNPASPAESARSYQRIVQPHPSNELRQALRFQLAHSGQKARMLDEIENYLKANCESIQDRIVQQICTASDELLMNAIFDASEESTGISTPRTAQMSLRGKRMVEVELGVFSEYFSLTVTDQFGSLKRSQLMGSVLKALDGEPHVVPEASYGCGIGLAVIFNMGGSLSYSVDPGKTTSANLVVKTASVYREFRTQLRSISIFGL